MKTLRYTLLILIAFQLTACQDFLDVKPQGELTQEAFPTTASDALLATNAVYATLRSWNYHSGGFPILDFMSDDAHKGSNPDDGLNTVGPYERFTHTPTQDGLDRWWSELYQGIKRANVVIEKVPLIDMDTTDRGRYIAEATFLRGLYYFDLLRAWGGVPIVLTTTPELKIPRSSTEEVYAQIEKDLLFAAARLPGKHEYHSQELGRASRGAAHALLARVYLFKKDFQAAEEHAMKLIQSTDFYDLEPLFENANGYLGEHGVESVFEIGAIGAEGAVGNQYANTQGVRGTPNRGWGFNRPSLNLRNAFDEEDPRRALTIIDLGDVIDDIEILGDGSTPDETYDGDGNIIEVECYNRKVWIPGANVASQFGHNRRLIRYADVLLMAAEALNENNKSGEALIHLNRVRERARHGNSEILPDITTTNKDELRSIILNERRLELALEGHRFWDLVRTGKAAEVLGPLGFETGKHELLPIPQNEIDISQGALDQNLNW
jgi:starch-binding outer membrane protein, SusD/RagB family